MTKKLTSWLYLHGKAMYRTFKTILKKNNVVGLAPPHDLKICHKTTVSSPDGDILVKR